MDDILNNIEDYNKKRKSKVTNTTQPTDKNLLKTLTSLYKK